MMPVVTIYTPIVVYEIACQDVHPHLPKDKQTATCQKGQNQFTSFMVHPACERKISMCENINAFSYILLLIFLLLLLIFLLLIIFYLFSCYLLFFTYFPVTYYFLLIFLLLIITTYVTFGPHLVHDSVDSRVASSPHLPCFQKAVCIRVD